MAIGIGVLIIVVAIGACLWMATSALSQIRQLRGELDETQRQLNELKAATDVVPAPPPLPRKTRSSDLEDLREQLRAAHREEAPSDE